LSVSPLPTGTSPETYASSRSTFSVFRNGNASVSSRKIPYEWFFCASIPAVTTSP